MAISVELQAQILRYHHVEKWRANTIARQLGIHHHTVHGVLARSGLVPHGPQTRPSQVDPYLPFILETLKAFPSLTAARLHGMVYERGYRGDSGHFRHIIARHRPRPKAEAYLRLRTFPGEQAQADWGHFGHLQIGRARRPLMAFVIVLSQSRQIFLRFFLDARMEAFLSGHVEAFERWGGVPKVVLYDNLKSAVLERRGNTVHYNPTLIAFSAHYRYDPRPVAVARGNEKGRVERAIRYIRDNFFAARSFKSLDDLNAQADAWCDGIAADRLCPGEDITVRQAFALEQPCLLPLPGNPFPWPAQIAVSIGKTPYARFDLNDYSVPHAYVCRTLSVTATQKEVRILDGLQIVARHVRSYDKGAQVEDTAHIKALVDEKRAARRHSATDRLAMAVPASTALLERAAQNGHSLHSAVIGLNRLLEHYGASELQAGILEVLEIDGPAPHPNAVQLILERRRERRRQPPLLHVALPQHVQDKDSPVRPARLDLYDQLKETPDDHS